MTNKKIILEELGRMREIMGLNEISKSRINLIKRLISEGDGTKGIIDEIIPGGAKTMDNLGKLAKTVDDLFVYSTRLSELAPSKSFDDFLAVVSKQNNNQDVTADMVRRFIASDAKLTDELMGAAAKISEEAVERLMQDVQFSDVFTKAGMSDLPETMKGILSVKIDSGSSSQVKAGLDSMEDVIKSTNLKDTVEGKELLDQIAGKRKQIGDYEDLQTKKSSPTPEPEPYKVPDAEPEFKPLFDSDAALESKVLDDLNAFKKQYPDVKGEELLKIKNDIMSKWKGIPDESTFKGQMDRITSDIEQKFKNIQQKIDSENDAAKRAELTEELGKTKQKWQTAKQVKEFCLGNWSKWKTGSSTLTQKAKMVGGALGGFTVCSFAAAVLIGEGTSHVKYFYYDNDGQYKNTFMCPIISGLPMFGTYMCKNDSKTGDFGWFSNMCPDTCRQEREGEDQSKTVFENKDTDFALWVTNNGGTLPNQDADGRFYTDKNNTKQYVTYDLEKRTFINKTTTPPPNPGTCVWKSDADAKTALKNTFTSAADADITVDLSNCKVTYKNPILGTSSTYGPTDL